MNKSKLLTLKMTLLKFSEVTTDKGTITIDGELAVGAEVFIEVEGEVVPAADGEYVLEDGRIVVVTEGKVSEIKEAEPAEPTEPAEPVANAEPTEPTNEPTEPAYDEKQAVINELTEKVAELEAELIEKENKITELEAKLSELEKPVDQPLDMKAQPQPFTVKSSGALKYFE